MPFPISIFVHTYFFFSNQMNMICMTYICYLGVIRIKFNTATNFSFDSFITYTKLPPLPLQQIRFRVAVKVFPPRRQTDEHQLAGECPGVRQRHASQH